VTGSSSDTAARLGRRRPGRRPGGRTRARDGCAGLDPGPASGTAAVTTLFQVPGLSRVWQRRFRKSRRSGPRAPCMPAAGVNPSFQHCNKAIHWPARLRSAPRARGAAAGGPCPGARPAPRRYALRASGPGSDLRSAGARVKRNKCICCLLNLYHTHA
jgi:hypothetical protein